MIIINRLLLSDRGAHFLCLSQVCQDWTGERLHFTVPYTFTHSITRCQVFRMFHTFFALIFICSTLSIISYDNLFNKTENVAHQAEVNFALSEGRPT